MGQLPSWAFQLYNPGNAGTIQAGPFSLFQVSVDSLAATQLNVGFIEVDKKADGFDELTSQTALAANLLTDIEPVVIGPGGVLYQTDGHHTFLALIDSGWGGTDPTVDVNVIANYSNLTPQQFFTTMEQNNLLYPVNDGVLQSVDQMTGAPLPGSLTGLTSDPYRGLEYAILKNKSSKLFTTTSNITGAIGSAIPGLDKTAAFYSDFIWADAYRGANGGLGLPYLSPTDILISTDWNLNGANQTTLPNIGTVTVSQLPGYILPATGSITITGTISNATLANGTLDGSKTGTFDETSTFASFNGLRGLDLGPVTIGAGAPGFIMQLGNDLGGTVTLSGSNTYTGGTTILAGTLIITGDASLGAAAPANPINLSSIAASVDADNGIVFNSLTEGNGTIQIGATATPGVNSFATNRPIAVDGEVANLNLNGNTLTLTGPIVSLGAISTGISNATGEADLTVEDNSSKGNGVLVLAPSSGGNPNFYGNWVITSGTLRVSSDAALGNTTGPSFEIGEIELNGGTFQAGASFSSVRSLFLASGSTYDTNGFASSFAGSIEDIQSTLTVINSSAGTAGSVTFGSLEVSATAILAINGGTGATSTTVDLTSGITRDAGATLLLQPASGTLGTREMLLQGTAPALSNGIAAPWIVINSAAANNPYDFVTYGANGYTTATYSAHTISNAVAGDVIKQGASATIGNTSALALNIQKGFNVTLNAGTTLTLGDGTDPAGLILNGGSGSGITAGTLAFGGSEGVIAINGSSTITSQITGTGGLTLAGSGTLTLSSASTETGAITIDSGTLTLTAANVFSNDVDGVLLSNTKSKPSAAILTVNANNMFTTLNSVGNNSTVNIGNGAALTIGDATNNLSSTLSSAIKETGSAVTGALTTNGSGLLDLSGGTVSLVAGSTVNVNGGALRIANGVFGATATTVIAVATGAELQYAGNGGSKFNDPIQGGGIFHLLAGTVQLTSTTNSYTGGTVLEVGTTLDVTTANLPTGGNVINAGGTLDFDQTTTGTFSGVMSDGVQAGGPNDPEALAVSQNVGIQALSSGPMVAIHAAPPTLPGTLIKDDSTGANSGNVTIGAVQLYTGFTYIEAGTLTLGVANAIEASSGVVLGRIGGGATATLALSANNTLTALSSDPSNTTTVDLNGNVLTLAPTATSSSSYGGVIADGSAEGSLVVSGTGTATLSGNNTFTGGVTIDEGTLELGSVGAAGSGAIAFGSGTSATLAIDHTAMPTNVISGFAIGDVVDLTGVAFDTHGSATLTSGNVLQVSENGNTYDLQLSPTTGGFDLAADAGGSGTAVFIGTPLSGGETLSVSSGQTSNGLIVTSGTEALVLSGGAADTTVVSSGGIAAIEAGGTASVTTVLSGGIQYDAGTASNTSLVGGTQVVFGSAGSTTIDNGGVQDVISGGTASGATVSSGGTQYDAGTASTTTLMSSGTQVVFARATSTMIDRGGIQEVVAGGTAISATVSGGGIQYDAGTANDTLISGGGNQLTVVSGATASATIVSGGGTQYDAGTASGTTLLGGGVQVVFGSAAGTTIDNAGAQIIVSGGTASGTTVSSGGFQYDAGTASGTTLDGGTLEVFSGGAINGATISSGLVELQSGATAGSSTITFAGGGTLKLDATGTYGSLVAGFAVPDAFDLSAISFASATKPYAGDTSSGTLTVSDGANSVSLLLLGNYTAASFNLGAESGGGTGTVVTDTPPASSGVVAASHG